MIEPLRLSFEVGCDPQHAFATWTERAASWWPKHFGQARRDTNRGGWDGTVPAYIAACAP
jgi:hypothetical protein